MNVLRILTVAMVLASLAGAAYAQPSQDSGELLFIADDEREAALAVSTGTHAVYGNAHLNEETVDGKTVYEIGEDKTPYPEISPGEVASLVGAEREVPCPGDRVARFSAAMVSSLNQSEVVCAGNASRADVSVDELKEAYVRRVSEEGDGINHVFLSSREMLPAAAMIAADQNAFLSVVGGGGGSINVSEGFEDGSLEDRWTVWKTGGGSAQVRRSGDVIEGTRVLAIDTEGEGDNGEVSINRSVDIDLSGDDVFTAYVRSREFRDTFAFSSSGMSHRRVGNFEFGVTGDCSFYTHNGTHKTERGCASSGEWYRLNATFHPETDTAEVWWENAGTENVMFHAEIPRKNLESFDTIHLRSADDEGFADEHHWDNISYTGVTGEMSPGEDETRAALDNAVAFLAERGMYVEGREQYSEGLYISLAGVLPANLTDSVEEGGWSVSDPVDGRYFHSDLQYGDLNGDGRIDAAVGRYPGNVSLAARMYLRSQQYDGKDALVASEYLHQHWPVILAYAGGGMYSGKSVETILEEQGYDVQRAVEYRAEPEEFLQDLTPSQMEDVLLESEIIGEAMGGVLGKSVGVVASKMFITLKALNYAERGLQQYLEFDWSTAGLDVDRARDRVPEEDVSELERAALEVSRDTAEEKVLAAGIVQKLVDEGVEEAAARAVYAFFWPDRYERIGAESLASGVARSDTVYYAGVGNGSAWILPNNVSDVAGVARTGRYNGSETFDAERIPENSLRLVFDNSDLAAGEGSRMRGAFLEHGAASFVGASTANYAPFSSEIVTTFFREGYTVGQSLRGAVNSFAEDSLVWDPFNTVARDGIKGKMLRSFRLFGNPEMGKDPEVEKKTFDEELACEGDVCRLELTAELNYSIIEASGERTLSVDSDGTLLRSFRPMIPLLKAKRHLPSGAEVLDYRVSEDSSVLDNVSVPVAEPLSHGGRIMEGTAAGWFPENRSRFTVSETVDGRKEIGFVHAAFQYHPGERSANISEKIELVVRYRTPYEMAVSVPDTADNRTDVSLEVLNEVDEFDADILVRVKDRNSIREEYVRRTVETGENSFEVPVSVPGEGTYEVEAYLFAGDQVLGPRKNTFTSEHTRTLGTPAPVKVSRRPSNVTVVWGDGLRASFTSSGLRIYLVTGGRTVSVERLPSAVLTVLETPEARVEERTVSGGKTVDVETPSGNATLTVAGGERKVETQGRVSVDLATELYRSLLEEKANILERYRRYRDSIPDPAVAGEE